MVLGPITVLSTFILFCRIGTCLMLMPGFSSSRVPVRVRLFIAIAITLVLAPVLLSDIEGAVGGLSAVAAARLIVSEMLIGAMIGILARVFFLALETLANATTMAIGFGPIPGTAIEDSEPLPPLVTLVTLSAVFLLFVTGQHWEILRGLSASYVALPVAQPFGPQLALMRLTSALADAFLVALRVSSPFIIYAVIVNFAIGITNKLTPQIPVYFISLPFILGGGLVLLYFIAPEMLHLFTDAVSSWLARG